MRLLSLVLLPLLLLTALASVFTAIGDMLSLSLFSLDCFLASISDKCCEAQLTTSGE